MPLSHNKRIVLVAYYSSYLLIYYANRARPLTCSLQNFQPSGIFRVVSENECCTVSLLSSTMRKSLMPSVIKSGVKPPIVSPPSGDVEIEMRRGAFCNLYNENDLTPNMRSKVSDVFRRPQQDASKVQLWDPDRATKTLGMRKLGAPRVARPLSAPVFQLAPAPATIEEETYTFDPLVLWTPEESEEPYEEGAPPAQRPTPIEVDPHLCRWLRPHQVCALAHIRFHPLLTNRHPSDWHPSSNCRAARGHPISVRLHHGPTGFRGRGSSAQPHATPRPSELPLPCRALYSLLVHSASTTVGQQKIRPAEADPHSPPRPTTNRLRCTAVPGLHSRRRHGPRQDTAVHHDHVDVNVSGVPAVPFCCGVQRR